MRSSSGSYSSTLPGGEQFARCGYANVFGGRLFLPDTIRRRARHVVTENERVGKFVAGCQAGDLNKLGELFLESHRSLQFDYEVSCEELDFLVDSAIAIDGVYGARMTGGGFGGCTVNLLAPSASGRFEQEIAEKYAARYAVRPQVYRGHSSAGASEIKA